MNIINIEHISKLYGDKLVFDDASIGISEGNKIGIVGLNGTGKTTFLKMISGLEVPDSGQVVKQNNLKVAMFSQNPVFEPEDTVMSYCMRDVGDDLWRVQSYLTQLGITDYEARLDAMSGGQVRRTAMAKVLGTDYDILLLDEPTNHLDEEMISWLETFLKGYKGTVIMVTHDRYFLDKVCNRILEISHGKIYSYDADYSGFLELKAEREEMDLASERKRQSILRIELEWAKRGCRARTTKQKARLERLEVLKQASGPVSDQTVFMDAVETRMGKKTIELHHISKHYGEKKIIDDFEYIVLKNQRLGIVGPNGCGKSTLMKIMAGEILPDQGSVEIGETIRIGYFAQEEQDMDDRLRVIDYVKDIAEYIETSEGRISASQMLERFLFIPDMQYAPIGKLSGGEKRRLYLLGVLSGGINVLLLDEPGNNLDIPTLTILEDFLNSFMGIVVTVSHDRYFLDNVVDRIFEFSGDGKLTQYEGGYTDYIEAKARRSASKVSAKEIQKNGGKSDAKEETQETKSQKSWKQNRPTKLKFTYKEQKEYETIDEDIEKLENRLDQIEKDMAANATNSGKLNDLLKEQEALNIQLEEKMERWVYLNDLAERINAQ